MGVNLKLNELELLKKSFYEYKKQGFYPVPCYLEMKINSKGKRIKVPTLPDWRSRDDFEFDDLMKERSQVPNSIAIKTGAKQNIIGIDIDIHDANGFDEIKSLDYENQYCTRTQSGGLHILFKHSEELLKRVLKQNPARTSLTTAKTKKGIDIRHDGGLLFIAPSKVFGGGEYTHEGSDTINEMTAEWQNFIYDLLKPSNIFNTTIVPNSHSFDWFGCVQWYQQRYSVGDRSSLDFWIAKRAVEFGKSETELKQILFEVPNSKIAEKKQHQQESYFNLTWSKAKLVSERRDKKIEIECKDGIIREYSTFWSVSVKEYKNDTHYKIKISNSKLVNLLSELGFYKTKYNGNFIYIWESEKSIIKITDIEEIRNVLSQHIKMFNELIETVNDEFEVTKNLILDLIIDYTKIDKAIFELPFKKVSYLTDSINKVSIPFRNGILRITKDSKYLETYSDCKDKIWLSTVINKDFIEDDSFIDFDFAKFVHNIANKEESRELAFKCAIGYLLSNYKNPSMAKMVYLIDEMLIDGEANGRTGKSLISKAIEKMTNLHRFDGQTFTFNDNHALSPISIETMVVDFNDMKSQFNYGKLFSLITDTWNIRGLYEKPKSINFKDSPKMMLSSNYNMSGVGDSFRDRYYLLEVSNHYSSTNKPIDEFGKLFFDDWNNDEWNLFYNFMVHCVTLFLKNGLPQVEYKHQEERTFHSLFPTDFIDFIESKINDDHILDKWIPKKDFRAEFELIYGKFSVKRNDFSNLINKYCKKKGYSIEESTKKHLSHFKYLSGKPAIDPTTKDFVYIKSGVSAFKISEDYQSTINTDDALF